MNAQFVQVDKEDFIRIDNIVAVYRDKGLWVELENGDSFSVAPEYENSTLNSLGLAHIAAHSTMGNGMRR